MLGMTAAMKREDYVPQAIAAGCDMFLFFNDLEEDFHFMLKGYQDGVITDDRLNDAVRRILGLKAKIHLPKSKHRVHYLKMKTNLALSVVMNT